MSELLSEIGIDPHVERSVVALWIADYDRPKFRAVARAQRLGVQRNKDRFDIAGSECVRELALRAGPVG